MFFLSGVPSRTCCVWLHQLLHFHIWDYLQSKTVSTFCERPLCLYFTAKTPKQHFRNREWRSFIVITWKLFKISKHADTVLNFSYLAIKLPNFKPVDEQLPELEPRVSHSFDIKIVSRKKLLKVLASPQTHFRWNFSVSKSRSVYEKSQHFFCWFKALPLIYPYG